jgi:membrane carboxypeptidase/penicillin-binding protein PbpC
VLDPSSGAILTMVGSPNYDDAAIQGQVNGALARRQPGSAIKPLTYAAALERGWTPASTILDIPTTFQTREGRPYAPQNYDRAYHGPLALREALATSSNVAAVRLLDNIGIPALLDMSKRLGITTLGQDTGRYGLSLTLGGGEVTPLELTAAFGAFANGGRRVVPYSIMSITNAEGISLIGERRTTKDERSTLFSESSGSSSSVIRPPSEEPQVLSPQIAFLITDILSDRYARMRAFGAQSALDIDRPAAAKTGTTSDWRDNWTVGYTPDRVVGVWVGNADGQPMEAISGVSGAGPLWHDVMLAAHRGLPPRQFARPDGIVETTICAEGGLLPTPSCPATRRERFLAGSEPHQLDKSHIAVAIDAQLGCRAPAGYPAERVSTRIFRILPPEAESWVVAAGLARVPSRVCAIDRATGRRGEGVTGQDDDALSPPHPLTPSPAPALLAPTPGAVFAISPGVPRERQQIQLQARAGADVAKLTLLVDGQPLAVFDGPPYRAYWQLAPGQHRAYVETTDAQGKVSRSATVEFVVEGT